MTHPNLNNFIAILTLATAIAGGAAALGKETTIPSFAYEFLENHCLDCHDALEQKGDLNLEELAFNLEDRQIFEKWALVHDRADHGEMPP